MVFSSYNINYNLLDDSESNKNGKRPEYTERLFSVPFRTIIIINFSLPIGALTFCVICSLIFNFTQTTSTRCHAPEFLPSLSTATRVNFLQTYIWRLAIALHVSPRFFISYLYYTQIRSTFLFSLNCIEIFCLLSLANDTTYETNCKYDYNWISCDNFVNC